MTNETTVATQPEFKDRKSGLIIFGIFEILFGTFCAFMVPLMLLGMLMTKATPGQEMNPRMMIPGILFYVAFAVWFIWMGIGSILARRWARALLLVTSWFWLVGGIMGMAFLMVLMPGMYEQMGKTGQMPAGFATIMKYITIGFSLVFYVLIPGVLVFFYGSRHVKATCERIDSTVRWTDKCPLPVLGISLMSGMSSVSILLMGFYGWVMPFFGTILSGISGAAVVLICIPILAYLSWGTYKLNINAWWGTVLVTILWGISSVITFSKVGLMTLYEKMEYPPQQIEMMKGFITPMQSWMIPCIGFWIVVVLGYLFYTKKYFSTSPEGKEGG